MLLRLFRIAAIYALVFLPLHCVLSVLEGAVRGNWPVTLHEFWYQSGAWAAYVAGSLLLVAIPTVVLLALVTPFGLVLSVIAGPVTLLIAAAILPVVPNDGAGIVELLLTFPVAFVIAGAILGYGAWRQSPHALRPAAA